MKPATLYAYVSRGLLRRVRGPDGQSRFSLVELERLGRRPRGGGRGSAATDLAIESGLTAIQDGSIFYRGEDALILARTRSFEEVAQWLWSGEFVDPEPWRSDPEAMAVAAAVQAGLPASVLPLDRLRVAAAALGATDELRYGTGRLGAMVTGRRLIAGLVDSLPHRLRGQLPPLRVQPGRPLSASLAGRLWAGLGKQPPPAGGLEALNAGLVLVADHELSTSTLAARLAASIKADPYAVVCVGLSALGGALQPVASLAAEALLGEVVEIDQAARVIGERLRRGERLPGFGHALHPAGDPRGGLLLDRLREPFEGTPRLAVVEAVLARAAERGLPAPNIDFALAALAHLGGMELGSSEAIFAVARSAGWLAHAIEEYGDASAIRPRAVYVGVPVGPER